MVTATLTSFANPNLEPEHNSKNNKSLESFEVTTPLPIKKQQEVSYHYPFLQSSSPRLGLLINPSDSLNADFTFGFTYLFPEYNSPHWEIGFDMTTDATAFIHLAKRHIFYERKPFRPFYKYGLGLLLEPKKNMAGLVELQNYHARVSIGLEDSLDAPMSARVELEVIAAQPNLLVSLNIGFSWGW